jgi:hypothetical protein
MQPHVMEPTVHATILHGPFLIVHVNVTLIMQPIVYVPNVSSYPNIMQHLIYVILYHQ